MKTKDVYPSKKKQDIDQSHADAREKDEHRDPAPFISSGLRLLRFAHKIVHAADNGIGLVRDGYIHWRVVLLAELILIHIALFSGGI